MYKGFVDRRGPVLDKKEGMMKKHFVCAVLRGLLLCVLFAVVGCGLATQPGETFAEGHRRHIRTARINQKLLMEDIDKVLLLDRPRSTSEMRIP